METMTLVNINDLSRSERIKIKRSRVEMMNLLIKERENGGYKARVRPSVFRRIFKTLTIW